MGQGWARNDPTYTHRAGMACCLLVAGPEFDVHEPCREPRCLGCDKRVVPTPGPTRSRVIEGDGGSQVNDRGSRWRRESVAQGVGVGESVTKGSQAMMA